MGETIRAQCGKCGKSLKCPANMAGKTGKCPNCGEVITIPVVLEVQSTSEGRHFPKATIGIVLGACVVTFLAGVFIVGPSRRNDANPSSADAGRSATSDLVEAKQVLEALSALETRTEVGIDHRDFSAALAQAVHAQKKLSSSKSSSDHRLLIKSLELATLCYLKAGSEWRAMIDAKGKLDAEHAKIKLKGQWQRASIHLDDARVLLANDGEFPVAYLSKKEDRDAKLAVLDEAQRALDTVMRDSERMMREIARPHLRSLVVTSKKMSTIESHIRKHGGELNDKDSDGQTPLHHATYYMKWEAAATLIENGADIGVTDVHGKSPLWYAIRGLRLRDKTGFLHTAMSTVDLLVEKGAAVTVADSDGDTLLHKIAEYTQTANTFSAASLLVSRGASISARNKRGDTPLKILRGNGYLNKDVVAKMYAEKLESLYGGKASQ